MPDLTPLVNVAISQLPAILDWIRSMHRSASGTDPTDAEVFAALQQAIESYIAKDDLWLEAHPEPTPKPPTP